MAEGQGIGKRVPVRAFPVQRRGGRGRKGIQLTGDDSLAAVHVVRAGPPSLHCITGSSAIYVFLKGMVTAI